MLPDFHSNNEVYSQVLRQIISLAYQCLQLNSVSFGPCAVSLNHCPEAKSSSSILAQIRALTTLPITSVYCMLTCRNANVFLRRSELGISCQKLHGKRANYVLKVVSRIKVFAEKEVFTCDRIFFISIFFSGSFLTSKMLNEFVLHVCISRNDI